MSDYRVHIKVRNARLLRAIEQAGHQPGQIFARLAGISYAGHLLSYLNLKRTPFDENGDGRVAGLLRERRMIDFNDAPAQQPAPQPAFDPAEVDVLRAELQARLESVLHLLFPAGKVRQGKFHIGDVLGSPGRSLEMVLSGDKIGLWTDRESGEGGDEFDLIARHHSFDARSDFPRVLVIVRELLGRAPKAAPRRASKSPTVDDLGPATAKWDYLDAQGNLIAVVYRYDPPGGRKEFRPWDVKRKKAAPPEPRPLYNQPGIASADTVILAEGEKCAQALIDAGHCATTAMHGANAPVEKTDWSPLEGKAVLIWPDKDKPGWVYADAASQAILAAGAASCHILYPPDAAQEGWDAADALQEDFDVAGFIAYGPRMQMQLVADEPRMDAANSGEESVWGTEDALALAFTRRYHQDWRYVAAWGRWLVWDGQRWRPEDTLAATDLIRHVCRYAAVRTDNIKVAAKLASSGTISGVERLARSDRRHAATTEEWDADPWLLNTPGGVVDLRHGRRRPHDRMDRMTKITTATPRGECPAWRKFLDEVTRACRWARSRSTPRARATPARPRWSRRPRHMGTPPRTTTRPMPWRCCIGPSRPRRRANEDS